jgi:hypothetical protein
MSNDPSSLDVKRSSSRAPVEGAGRALWDLHRGSADVLVSGADPAGSRDAIAWMAIDRWPCRSADKVATEAVAHSGDAARSGQVHGGL